MRTKHEVGDILRRNHHNIGKLTKNSWQSRTLYALAACRTHLLGGHIDKCSNPDCNHIHISYNSCRNRHCPKCQGHKREEWIEKRESELINAPYYHLVFTLPEELNHIALYKPKLLYNILFKITWSVIRDFAGNPKFLGAKTGMIAILHTWGQNLSLHPHLHCIVPGGGISHGKWKYARGKDKYLFPVKAMSKVFRARFMEEMRKEICLTYQCEKALFAKKWVVYCKRPFWGASQVVEYLGRYTHKIAISNHRLKNLDNKSVTFLAKDYRHGEKPYLLKLSDHEFIRRLAMHILPKGFTRIRHYGILSSACKNKLLPVIEQQIGKPCCLPVRKTSMHKRCPVCKRGTLITICFFDKRGPPSGMFQNATVPALSA